MKNNEHTAVSDYLDEEIPNPFEEDTDTLKKRNHRRRQGSAKKHGVKKGPVTWTSALEEISDITWLWEDFIPNGFCTMIASPPGVGKSNLLLHLAKVFIHGGTWPDGTEAEASDKNVLWIEAESGLRMNMNRAKAWDVDTDRIVSPFVDPFTDASFDNKDHREICKELIMDDDIGLIVVDSLSGLHTMEENNARVGKIIKYLAEWATESNKPVLIAHHMKKEGSGMNGVRGSSAIAQYARVIMELATHNDVRKLSIVKNNLGEFPDSIQMVINDDGLAFGDWEESEVDDCHPLPKNDTKKGLAKQFLKERLANEDVHSKTLFAEAHHLGISKKTLNLAKKDLGIVSDRNGNKWFWLSPKTEIQNEAYLEDPFLD